MFDFPFLSSPLQTIIVFEHLVYTCEAMLRANTWFVPAEGIAREVIAADIQRYLGLDAAVRPGLGIDDFDGRNGYWITAHRTLTSDMIQDMKLDSQRWREEQQRGERSMLAAAINF